MPTNKILIYSVVISLVMHLAALSLASLIGWQAKKPQERVLTVDLKEMFASIEKKPVPEKKPLPPKEKTPPPKTRPQTATDKKAAPDKKIAPNPKTVALASGKVKEATVNLNSKDALYKPYLKVVKEKIENAWNYPEQASAQKEEGTAVVRLSLTDTGETDTTLIKSSGYPLLDEATMHAVKTPRFAPLPGAFQLSRLNVIITFEYRLSD